MFGLFVFFFVLGDIAVSQLQDDTVHPANASPTKYLDVKGARLHYTVGGSGKTCMVIGSSIYYPRTFSDNLKEKLNIIFVDTRHYVPNDESYSIDSITLDTYLSDIEKIRMTLGLKEFIILGHSVHSLLALEYARKYPDYISHVVMIGAFPYGGAKLADASDKFWDNKASDERKTLYDKNMALLETEAYANPSPGEEFINDYILSGPMYWKDPAYDCTWLWKDIKLNMDVLSRLFRGIISQYEVGSDSAEITTPVFLAAGKYDYIAPYYLWDDFKGQFSNLSFNLFEESGHTPQLEEQTLFDRKLIEWLGRN
jgi:proline iminopeptidase